MTTGIWSWIANECGWIRKPTRKVDAIFVLAFDTSTSNETVAILHGHETIVACRRDCKNHSSTLLPSVESLLQEAGLAASDLKLIAIGLGPGSFTGLRVGLTVAKGLAYALKIPLKGVSSLQALACNLQHEANNLICPTMDALKGEVYSAVYRFAPDGGFLQLLTQAARNPEEFARKISQFEYDCVLIGTGVARYHELWSRILRDRLVIPEQDWLHQVKAEEIGRLALSAYLREGGDDPKIVEPDYCRLSEAESARNVHKTPPETPR